MSAYSEELRARRARLGFPQAQGFATKPTDTRDETIARLENKLAERDLEIAGLKNVLSNQRKLISQFADQSEAPLARVQDIVHCVAEHFHISVPMLLSESRVRKNVTARNVVYFLGRKAGYSFPEIGRAFNRDHSGVMYGCNMLELRLARGDAALQSHVRAVEDKIPQHVAHRIATTRGAS
jgi:chromosomal replication initiation ATPase DnaA